MQAAVGVEGDVAEEEEEEEDVVVAVDVEGEGDVVVVVVAVVVVVDGQVSASGFLLLKTEFYDSKTIFLCTCYLHFVQFATVLVCLGYILFSAAQSNGKSLKDIAHILCSSGHTYNIHDQT